MNNKAWKAFLGVLLEIENRWKLKVASRVIYQAKQKRLRRALLKRCLVNAGGFGPKRVL